MRPTYIEKWLPVVGYPGYEVSNLGSVRSLKKRPDGSPQARDEGGVLAQRYDRHGYALVSLDRDGKRHTLLVHRIVLEAFVGPRPLGHVADHFDSIRTHNTVMNLRWILAADNTRRGVHKRRGEANGKSKLTEANVHEIRALRAQGLLQREIAAKFGVSERAVHHILKGETWAHLAPKETP